MSRCTPSWRWRLCGLCAIVVREPLSGSAAVGCGKARRDGVRGCWEGSWGNRAGGEIHLEKNDAVVPAALRRAYSTGWKSKTHLITIRALSFLSVKYAQTCMFFFQMRTLFAKASEQFENDYFLMITERANPLWFCMPYSLRASSLSLIRYVKPIGSN